MKKCFPESEVCIACRGCCRFAEKHSIWHPSVTAGEARRLLKDPALKKIPALYCGEEADYICIFLRQKDNLCSVYSRRPLECRLYPFLINRKGKKIYLAVHPACPAVGKDAASARIRDCAGAFGKMIRGKAFARLLKDNQHLPQRYPGAVNLIEIKPARWKSKP